MKLTPRQREVIVDVLNHTLAGGAEDWRDATGRTLEEAIRDIEIMERLVKKL